MPVTVRQLETLIRISTAIAKARLAKNVERSDAEKAYQLLHYACFKEKPKERLEMEEKRRKKQGLNGESDDDDDETEDEEIGDLQVSLSFFLIFGFCHVFMIHLN